MRSIYDKIKSPLEMKAIADRLRNEGKTVVFTNGCFDILHLGHSRYLNRAKTLGDVLVVGLNSDESVRSYKGDSRPLVTENDRAEMIASLESVDYVTVFNERTPENLITLLRPHIQVKGGDYRPEDVPEAKVMEKWGGRLEIVPLEPGRGTTNIINRIIELDRTGKIDGRSGKS